ncbi:MAG: hypothetical protein ACK5EA_17930 [Planctomycetaceae bacterium]|jgi:hypothetical protein
MSFPELSRREFQSLSAAALGGLLSGLLTGCGEPPAVNPAGARGAGSKGTGDKGAGETADEFDMLASEVHVCRGLNTCRGRGLGGENSCAGQGDCATPAAHHDCGGSNECKGLGGCGETAGRNSCKGQGGCHVPLMAYAWTDARKQFEAQMQRAGKEFGAAPAKKKPVPKQPPTEQGS